ncbi:GDP-mannose 4,6-dehydratase [Candidatus Roizmanbacteria bacterium]|nr:GDP-mannose 4,6-dehydratase [Candidatus Roizmanbacteria bacterium]
MKQTILITGIAGFIAHHIAIKFLEKEYKVLGIDDISTYPIKFYKKRLQYLYKYRNFEFIKISILNKKVICQIISKYKPEYLIHCAAIKKKKKSIMNPNLCLETNIIGTVNLLEGIHIYNQKTKLILLSSSSIYGKQDELPLKEEMSPNPISPYGFSKYAMELLARQYFELFKIPIVIIRPFSIYGPRGRFDMAPFLAIKAAEAGRSFLKYGSDKNNQRDWTYIDDFVDGIIRIVENYPFRSFEIFNLGNGKPVGIDQFVSITKRLIKKYLNKNLKIIQKPKRNFEMRSNYGSIEKAKKILKYTPKIDFKEGFEKLLQHYV